MTSIAETYKRFNLSFVKGKGCFLYSANNEKYLDLVGGIAVCVLGHGYPEFNKILKAQIDNILHVSNLYNIPPQEDLAKKICNISFADKVFFCNSGAEANEAAIKLVRKHGSSIKSSKQVILSCINSFHGRTTGALSITGQEKYRKDFGELLPYVDFVEFNNTKSLTEKFSENVAGFFIEIIQGEGGINVINREFLEKARELCNKFNAVLVYDEVQTGVGRTGKYFAYEHFNIEPDIMTLAKALGGGIPIGALAGKKEFMQILSAGTHASTFGGNYLASAAGCAVLDIIEKGKILNKVKSNGEYFFKNLENLSKEFPFIKRVKGLGLILGLELDFQAADVVNELIKEKVLTVTAGEKVLRFVPPLIITKEEIDMALKKLRKVFKVF
jgi:predicted acetylornithine/succinylornithine family transaminase